MASHMEPIVLIVDDEKGIRDSLQKIFSKEGYHAICASNGEEALIKARQDQPHVVITDLVMPGMDGMDFLRAARTIDDELEIVMMTAFGTVDSAVNAMRNGAYDFITKPLKRHEVVKTVKRALEHRMLITENKRLKNQVATIDSGIIASSKIMEQLLQTVKQAANTDVTILVTGESGTGKEVLARFIHQNSPRENNPFIAINCAALPETILESELFGHEKGAFTGASSSREGRFQRANHGTLFLDEVGEMSPALQVKLLRVLQDGSFDRVGGQETLHTDARIIAATNVDLQQAVKQGRFREDLYYRLNVVTVQLPALRERPEDISLLALHFLQRYKEKHQRSVNGISEAAMNQLELYHWPGNVRELENTIERAVVLTQDELLQPKDFPEQITNQAPNQSQGFISIPWGMPLAEVEQLLIKETLKKTNNDKKLTAQLLGITTRTIYRKLEETKNE